MPILKTCLLISDDPDDHFEFSEALHDASPDVVLVSVFDSRKIVELLKSKRILPDIVFLDVSMTESSQNQIVELFRSDTSLSRVSLINYGGEGTKGSLTSTLAKDYSYTELKAFIKRSLAGSDGQA